MLLSVCRAKVRSVQKAEEPERDLVSVADCRIIADDEAVGDICNLSIALRLAADFKRPLAIHDKVADARERHGMVLSELVEEKRLTRKAFVRTGNERLHQIRVVAIDLLRLGQAVQQTSTSSVVNLAAILATQLVNLTIILPCIVNALLF